MQESIGKHFPPLRERGYHPMSFGGKNMKREREKRGKCKIKRKKGERTRKKGGKEKELRKWEVRE
jgi:hypothetical protein